MLYTASELLGEAHKGGTPGIARFHPGDLDPGSDPDYPEYDDEGNQYHEPPQTVQEGWSDKLVPGLRDSIASEGVRRPVKLHLGPEEIGGEEDDLGTRSWNKGYQTGTVMNGHHRIRSAHAANPNTLVPVVWDDTEVPGTDFRVDPNERQ